MPGISINIIRVGSELFTAADITTINNAIEVLRTTYATVGLTLRRVERFVIPLSDAFIARIYSGVAPMRKRLVPLALTLFFPITPASAAVITFNGLQTTSAFTTTYTESGFNVSPASNEWVVWTFYGNPAPAIVFFNPDTTFETSARISVTAGGGLFTFQSVDLYSSVSPIPFVFVGLLNSTVVLAQSGALPNTFGNFRTVPVNSTQPIDTLLITVVNPSTAPFAGINPAGLDNIVVNRVPEPTTLVLMTAGLAVVARRMKRR